ncbi:hypothetical protein K438DRAFT_1774149 [Mycena galopus ATCC 62051]|nr:hypothetical protein K438DRAFT_1774149 [Mycena galopus ATCC 62051]
MSTGDANRKSSLGLYAHQYASIGTVGCCVSRHVYVEEDMQRATNTIHQDPALEMAVVREVTTKTLNGDSRKEWYKRRSSEAYRWLGVSYAQAEHDEFVAMRAIQRRTQNPKLWIDIGGSDNGRTSSVHLGDVRVLRRELWGWSMGRQKRNVGLAGGTGGFKSQRRGEAQ